MKKLLSVLAIFATLALVIVLTRVAYAQGETPSPPPEPTASFESSYTTYVALYDQYRVIFAEYLKARNNYFTYGTLAAQTDVIEKAKEFMTIRDEILLTYVDLLFLRNVSPLYNEILFQEKVFLLNHQSLIPAIASVKDASKLSEKIAKHYPILEELSRQVTGTILLSRVENVEGQVSEFENEFKDFTIRLEAQGYDIVTLERGIIESSNKLLLAQQNLNEARLKIVQLQGNAKEYSKVRSTLFSSNQYLKESTTFYEELLREVKYGNY